MVYTYICRELKQTIMKPSEIVIIYSPLYTCRKEVFKAAHINRDFYSSFSESLKASWRFYKTK